ncbi:hypothetical protein T4B_581 [Trichinella pseudospiralis]|uniref:Uncharacterized protein n=1 Tax=Trichinella pseudospiralis TaxID=6337 RepID=A0A0V1G792_TRIPS|nr:hypothetical protein T4B_581 [Trichinella pseudospiralis]
MIHQICRHEMKKAKPKEPTQQRGLCILCLSFWHILVVILGQQQKQ